MRAINIFVTEKCNMSCSYCYEGKQKRNGSLNQKMIIQIISFLKKYGKKSKQIHVHFHGGEPFLAFEQMFCLVEEMEKLSMNFSYSITSNGTMISDEHINWMILHKISLSISIDGTKKINDKYRLDYAGNSTHKKVLTTINKCTEKGLYVKIRMTIKPTTVSELQSSVFYLIKMNCYDIVAMPDLYDKNWTTKHILTLEKCLLEIYTELLNFKSVRFVFWSDLEKKKLGYCFGGIEEFVIDSFGKIYPCTFCFKDPKFVIGDIWNGLNQKKIAFYQKACKRKNTECRECKNSESCLAQRCKYLNYAINGQFYSPSVLVCELENMNIRLSRKIK